MNTNREKALIAFLKFPTSGKGGQKWGTRRQCLERERSFRFLKC